MKAENGTNVITNIQIIIDTDKVIREHPSPSQDPNNPTGLAHSYQYMVVSGNQSIAGQGTPDLNFLAFPGDIVRMTMASEYNNLDNPLLIYDIRKFGSSDQVLGKFSSQNVNTKTVVPQVGDVVLPPVIEERKFWYFQADVITHGTENYQVWFAMYQRVRGGNPTLFGFFYWDPTITVREG